MVVVPSGDRGRNASSLARLGGGAILLAFGIHILVNIFLKEFPPEDASTEQLRKYLEAEADTWAVVHGLRYVAFAAICVFAAGLFSRVRGDSSGSGFTWAVVGLLGTAIWVANGVVTNGIEIVAFLNLPLVSEQPRLFWLLFRVTRVLFTAEVAAWAITIVGFSMAGLCSHTIPRWLSTLGLFAGAAALLSSCLVVSVIRNGMATIIIDLATLASLAWFLCIGFYLVLRGHVETSS